MCDSTKLFPPKQTDLHNCWIIYTNSDGKEIKPIINTTENLNPNLPKIEGASDSDPDEDDDNGQSWHEVLDTELQPETPIPDNPESQEIYAEHIRLAKQYLKTQTKLYFSQKFKENILEEMSPEEQKEKEELLQKLKEKQELLELYNNLNRLNNPQTVTTADTNQPNDLLADDSWVIVNGNNQNS